MNNQQSAWVTVVKEGVAIDAKQEIPYFVGVSARTTGARGISMQRTVIPPGGAAKAHIHVGFESAIYVLQGWVEMRYGPGLRESVINGPGDFIYIPADVPHQPRNLSETEPAIAIVARNDPDDQEHVIPYDPTSEAGE